MSRLAVHGTTVLIVLSLCGCGGSRGDSTIPPIPQPETPTPPAPDEQPSPTTPSEEEELRRSYAEILWQTNLGKSYRELLFADYPRELFPHRCQQLALRIVSETKKMAPRLAVIRILNDDLYIVGEMNDDVRAKIQLLEAEIQKDRDEAQVSAIRGVFQQMPFVFLAGLPWGSPLVRSELRNLSKQTSHLAFSHFRRVKTPKPPPVQWRALFSRKALENYEIGKPVQLFFQTAGPFSIIELLLVKDVAGNLIGEVLLAEMIEIADF